MVLLLILLILLLVSVAVVGTIVVTGRDGYRRVPTDRSRLP